MFTGKGGTGKSWLTAQVAKAAAADGLRVALVRVASLAEAHDAPYPAEDEIAADAPYDRFDRFELDAQSALAALLGNVIGLRFIVRRLMASRTFTALGAAAPGLADLATLSQIADLGLPARSGYDLVLVDAPATGHALPLLTAPRRVADFIGFGPIAALVKRLDGFVNDPEIFQVVIVTGAEELPVSETLALADDLKKAHLPAPLVVANALLPRLCDNETAAWLQTHEVSKDSLVYLKRSGSQAGLLTQLRERFYDLLTVDLQLDGDAANDVAPDIKLLVDACCAETA